jgi:ABC-type lipoprotein export system ATPase subunit
MNVEANPGSTEASEYLMIDSVHIKNLHGFRDMSLTGLKRINVITGDSGSGKSAFLESIWVAGGSNPEIYMRSRHWRGLVDPTRIAPTRRGYESLFRELFFDFDQSQTASIRFTDSERGERSLTVKYRPDEEYSLSLQGRGEISPLVMVPLQFKWSVKGKTHETTVQVTDGNLKFSGFQDVYPVWLISPTSGDAIAEHFSELSKRKQQVPIVDAIRKVFPAISALSLESIAGQIVVCASVDYLKEKLPIGMVSAGITKYLWILTAIASNPGGVVLIDEIEGGFYHRSLQIVLNSMITFAEENHVQLFATTHSAEFLEAVAEAMESRQEQLAFIHAERAGRECTMRVARGPSSVAAIRQRIELR